MNKDGMSKLEELRRKKGLTQTAMKTKFMIDQSDYSKLERGLREMTLYQCKQFAKFYGVSMDYLADLTDDPRYYPRKKSE